jgi:PAS domain S-box-containing protein
MGGGEMGELIRAHPWAATPLGPIEAWPQSLRTLVDLVLGSRVMMSLMLGPRAILVYNDAYAAGIGKRHPQALGASAFDAFSDALPVWAPLFERALAGECVSARDLQFRFSPGELPRDEAWYDLTYSPVRDECGEVAGALAVLVETTERVLAEGENAAARRAMQATEARQAYLLRLADALRRLSDPVEIQHVATRVLCQYLGVAHAQYYAADRSEASGGFADRVPAAVAPLRLGDPGAPLAETYHDGRTIVVGDVEADSRVSAAERANYTQLGFRAFVGAPLLKDGRVVALLGVADDRPRDWRDQDVVLIEHTAERTWAAIERARAEEALRTNQQRLRAQQEAFQAAMDGAPLEACLGVLARLVSAEIRGDARTAFYIADADGLHLHPIRGAGDMRDPFLDLVDGFLIGEDSLACGLSTATGRPVVTRDVFSEPLWEAWVHIARAHDFRGCWSFPIDTREGRTVGTFALYFRTPREPGPAELTLIDLVTQTAAIIIARHTEAQERARAEGSLRASQERLASQATLLANVPEAMTATDEQFVITYWNQAAEELFGRKAEEVLGHPSMDVFWTAAPGWNRDAAIARMLERGSYEGEVVCHRGDGSPLLTEVRAAVLRGKGGEFCGTVTAFRDITERKQAEAALRESEARIAVSEAVAAERQALLKRIVRAQEDDRARISREIHDSVTQLAHAAAIHLDRAVELLPSCPEQARGSAERGRDLARQAANEARRLIAGLRPEMLDLVGLAGAIQQEVDALRRAGWRVELDDADLAGVRLGAEAEITLFRVAQEALSNVRKHAGHGRVRVHLRRLDGSVRLEVRDWGRGFDPRVVRPTSDGEHVGLTSMRERMGLLGGRLQVRSGADHGTTIRATLPFEEAPPRGRAWPGRDGRAG